MDQPTFHTLEFTNDEFSQVIQQSRELIRRGYISGINFLQSDTKLPKAYIVIHFLHDSERHLDEIESSIPTRHEIVPRFTYYILRPEYFRKPNFKEEYKDAIFFDPSLRVISIDEAIQNPEGITVSNKEFDLLVKLEEKGMLEETIRSLTLADRQGSYPWIDPVIIVTTENEIEVPANFRDNQFVSITKKREGFYSIISDKIRGEALRKYLDKLCAKTNIGNLRRSDIVFSPSRINPEFEAYLRGIQNELLEVE